MATTASVPFIVRSTSIYLDGRKTSGSQWKIFPPVARVARGGFVEVIVAGAASHKIELRSSIFIPDPVIVEGHSATVQISEKGVSGEYYEFEVFVDGQFVEAGSSPGVIIE